jgi:hypothetical protein
MKPKQKKMLQDIQDWLYENTIQNVNKKTLKVHYFLKSSIFQINLQRKGATFNGRL